MGTIRNLTGEPIVSPGVTPAKSIFVDLGTSSIPLVPDGLTFDVLTGVPELIRWIDRADTATAWFLIGISRNLMDNYLALSALHFRHRSAHYPFMLIQPVDQAISPYKSFLFGQEPVPVSKLDQETFKWLFHQRNTNGRAFHRLAIEFLAFIEDPVSRVSTPVVCRNVSWNGAYFETRKALKLDDFTLTLRSRLHRISIPARIMRREKVDAPSPCYGYGARFRMPLPLSLIHYLFLKSRKNKG